MPFVDPKDLTPFSQDIPVEQQVEAETPEVWESVKAGMRKHNPAITLAYRGFKPDFPAEEGYDPYSVGDDEGYDPFLFTETQSTQESQWIKDQADSEKIDDQILNDSGWVGVVYEVAGGVTSPILLASLFIPGGQAGILARAATEFGIAASAEVVSEVALQNLQETRTMEQSVFNVAAAAVTAGVMGGVIAKLTKKEVAEIHQKLVTEITEPEPTLPSNLQAPGGAQSSGWTLEEMTPMQWGPVLRQMAKLTPQGRLMMSPSVRSRQYQLDMAETPYLLKGNEAGKSINAIETEIKKWDANAGEAIEAEMAQFKAYKKDGGTLNRSDFSIEVGNSLSREESTSNKFFDSAAKAWRSQYNKVERAAKDVDLLPEEFKLMGAKSYFPRIPNRIKIGMNPNGFVKDIADAFQANNPKLERDIAEELALDTKNKYMGLESNQIPGNIESSSRGFKARTLDVPDEILQPWLIRDAEVVGRMHIKQSATQIEITKRFGGGGFDNIKKSVEEDYAVLMNNAEPAKAIKLGKRMVRDIADLESEYGRLKGTYGLPSDPSHMFHRVVRVGKQFNVTRMLGGMTLSAIPDTARPVLEYGMSGYAKEIAKITSDIPRMKLAAADAKRQAAGWDMVLNGRMKAYSDLQDLPMGYGSKFEIGVEKMTTNFAKLSLMPQWNSVQKQFNGIMAADANLRMIVRGPTKLETTKLARWGIRESMHKRIAKQVQEFGDMGKNGDINIGLSYKWEDKEAASAFSSAILKQVDTMIVTPGIGDKPRIMSDPIVGPVFQFKSFAFSATNRILLSGLGYEKMNTFNFIMTSIALGSGVAALKLWSSGHWDKAEKMTPSDWVIEGIDRSGVTGIFFEGANIMGKQLGKSTSRYASRSFAESLFGPVYGLPPTFYDIYGRAAKGAREGGIRKSDVHQVRKLIPYNNIFYFRQIIDEMENGIAQSLGAQ